MTADAGGRLTLGQCWGTGESESHLSYHGRFIWSCTWQMRRNSNMFRVTLFDPIKCKMVLDQCVTWPLVRSLLQSQYLRLVYCCGGTLCPWVVQVQQVWSLIFHDVHRYVGEFLNTEYLIESITMVIGLLGRITIRSTLLLFYSSTFLLFYFSTFLLSYFSFFNFTTFLLFNFSTFLLFHFFTFLLF